MSEISLALLDKNRRSIFNKLAVFNKFGYLAGGTALALQLNHRKSFDFDIFVTKPITNTLRKQIRLVFGNQNLSVNTPDQLTFASLPETEITFLYYWYEPIQPLIQTQSISLASLEDIAADKAHTLGHRATWRDYVDLFWLMKYTNMTIVSIIKAAEKKFSGDFVNAQFIEQLGYFDDVIVMPIDYLKDTYNPKEIKQYLTDASVAYLKTIL